MALNFNDTAIGGGALGGSIGGYGYGGGGFGGGGFGGIAPFGLFGLIGAGGLDRGRGHDHGDDNGCGNLAILAAISNLKDGDCGREAAILSAISNAKDTTVAEGRSLAGAICAVNGNIKDAQFALAVQSERNTAQLSAQAQALAIVADKRFDDLSLQISNEGSLTRALINSNTIQDLRDQLNHSHRHTDVQDIKIENNNINTNVQQQLQAQAQIQRDRDFEHQRRFDALFASFNQINRNTQDIINLGTMTASGTQANTQTNIK